MRALRRILATRFAVSSRSSSRLLACTAVLACGGNPSPQLSPTGDGAWQFTASTGEAVPLRGTLVVLSGTLTLRPELGSCREDAAAPSAERVRFTCDNTSSVERLVFIIDRRHPLTRSSWAGQVRQTRTRTVCARYATQNGRQVCVAQRTETQDVRVPVSGPLTFRPAG